MVSDSKKKRKNRNNKRKKLKKGNDVEQHDEDHTRPDLESNEDQDADSDTKTDTNLKRSFEGNDSDTEEKPQKKKKKKKQPAHVETSDKKGAKSIRQMKREKFAQRQAESKVLAKDQFKSQCINYLSEWKHNKDNWKFMKVKQVWLYKNMFSSDLVPNESWPTLLEYFEAAQGNIRKLILEDANKVIKQLDEWTESQKNTNEEELEENTTSSKPQKPSDTAYKRARDLIQCLEE